MTKKIFSYTDNMQKGLFAYYWGVLHAISQLNGDDKLYVDLSQKTPYYDPNYKLTDNVWEYYFEQPFSDYDLRDSIPSNFNTFCPVPTNFKFGLDGQGNYSLSEKSLNFYESFKLGKLLTEKYIKFKPHIIEKVENFYHEYMRGKNTLGVQYRGGEAFHTAHARNQHQHMNIEYHISKIDENFKTGEYDQIFLITNDQYARDILMDHYGSKIIKYESDLLCPVGVHLDVPWLHNDRNYEKGEFAVIDCLLLSKCQKILATSSNLTCLSVVLSDGQFEYIDKHINYS